jgi:hypothetical protein
MVKFTIFIPDTAQQLGIKSHSKPPTSFFLFRPTSGRYEAKKNTTLAYAQQAQTV